MAGHTPGPWEVAGNCVRTRYRMGDPDNSGVLVADVGVHLAERHANARLIAASPDVVEALILALPYVEAAEQDETYKPGAVAKVTAAIRAALSKATGEAL